MRGKLDKTLKQTPVASLLPRPSGLCCMA